MNLLIYIFINSKDIINISDIFKLMNVKDKKN